MAEQSGRQPFSVPASQTSLPTTSPSWQISRQVVVEEHFQPGTIMQSMHPGESISQVSVKFRILSPHFEH